MEIVWYGMNYKQPRKDQVGVKFLVTVWIPNKIPETDVMFMDWSKEITRKGEVYYWKMENGTKCPSTWEITYWADKPKPAGEEGEY